MQDEKKQVVPASSEEDNLNDKGTVADEEYVEVEEDNSKEKAEQTPPSISNNSGYKKIIAVLVAVIIALVLAVGCLTTNDNFLDDDTMDASKVMSERNSPNLKAKDLNPTKVYKLKSAADSFNGLSVAVTKVQFRQDTTRLWVKIDNDSGKTISMIPSANAHLTDDNGRIYKTDPFGGDQVSSIAAGAHEEIMLTFEPIRSEAKSLTFTLDSVFDMKHSAWNYSVQFDIP